LLKKTTSPFWLLTDITHTGIRISRIRHRF
jgi:hypothetical protein